MIVGSLTEPGLSVYERELRRSYYVLPRRLCDTMADSANELYLGRVRDALGHYGTSLEVQVTATVDEGPCSEDLRDVLLQYGVQPVVVHIADDGSRLNPLDTFNGQQVQNLIPNQALL